MLVGKGDEMIVVYYKIFIFSSEMIVAYFKSALLNFKL